MNPNHRQNTLLLGFIALSLLLHLLLILLPQNDLFPRPPAKRPVTVELQPTPPPARPRERELDLPKTPDQKRKTPAKRLGPSSHVAKKETAPKGKDTEDLTPRTLPRPAVRPHPKPRATSRPQPKSPPKAMVEAPEGTSPAPPKGRQKEAPVRPNRPLPNLRDLTKLAPRTLARLENQEERWRRKYRKDVAEGNAVWLDTEKDILISFFRRFRQNIYNVWNYPSQAAARGEEGTCLLEITVNRDGTVDGVKLMESSGYPLLDREAQAAVRKGAPYGPLPRAYPKNRLNIFAFFKYNLTGRAIY
jgi:protein TonB